MKLEQLLESYFPGLYHISLEKDLTKKLASLFSPIYSVKGINKPGNAFWLAKGLSWHHWASGEGFRDTANQYLHRVKLKPKANILQINKDNYKKYFTKEHFEMPSIAWEELVKKYDGVQIYHVRGFPGIKPFLGMSPFHAWDVPSVALFNKDAIQSIKNLGLVKDTMKKKRKK